jgi:MFS family permease
MTHQNIRKNPAVSKKGSSWPTLVCLSAGLYFLYVFFQLSMLSVINEMVRQTFQMNSTQMGLLSNAFKLMNLLFLFPAGIILDRYSTRRVILMTFAVCILGTFGFAYAPTIRLAALSFGIIGIGNAFCLAAGVILIARWLPENKQAFYIGLLITMAYTGGILSQEPLVHLLDYVSWREAVAISGLIGLLMLLWIALIVSDSPEKTFKIAPSAKGTSMFSALKPALINPQNWFGGMYIALINAPVMVLGALWGADYLQTTQHIPALIASRVIGLFFLGTMMGGPLVGLISDKIGRRKPIMYAGAIGLTLLYIPFVTGMVLPNHLLFMLFLLIGLLCSTHAIGYPLISESNHYDAIGKATSMATFLLMSIGAFSGGAFSRILDLMRHDATAHYTAEHFRHAAFIFPLTSLLALAMLFFIRETYCSRQETLNSI